MSLRVGLRGRRGRGVRTSGSGVHRSRSSGSEVHRL